MPCERLTAKVLRFEGANYDPEKLPLTGNGVVVRFCEVDGWIEMSLVIREDATTTGIRQFLPYAMEWRDRLTVYQGRWTKGGDGELYEMLRFRHRTGQSYGKLADWLNRRIAAILQDSEDPYRLDRAVGLMQAMGVEEAEGWAIGAMENLQNGRAAFEQRDTSVLRDTPIDRGMVRNAIRTWDRKQSKEWEDPRLLE